MTADLVYAFGLKTGDAGCGSGICCGYISNTLRSMHQPEMIEEHIKA